MPRLLASLFVLSGLAACGGPFVSPVDYNNPRVRPIFTYYAARGPVPVEIHGNPFAVPDQVFSTAVSDLLVTPPTYPPARFRPAEPPVGPFRVVLLFGGAPAAGGWQVCRGEPVFAAGRQERLRVVGAVCYRDEPLSDARGQVVAAGIADPGFRRLLYDLSYSLLPPERIDGGERIGPITLLD